MKPNLKHFTPNSNVNHTPWKALDQDLLAQLVVPTEVMHQGTKLVAAHFGGTRTPMVMSWPKAPLSSLIKTFHLDGLFVEILRVKGDASTGRWQKVIACHWNLYLRGCHSMLDSMSHLFNINIIQYQTFTKSSSLHALANNTSCIYAARILQTCRLVGQSCRQQVIKHDATPRSQFHHVCDIAPTIYEALIYLFFNARTRKFSWSSFYLVL